MAIDPLGLFYQQVDPEDAREIVSRTILGGQIVERLLYREEDKRGRLCVHSGDIPFYRNQHRRVLANCGKIDPTNLDSLHRKRAATRPLPRSSRP